MTTILRLSKWCRTCKFLASLGNYLHKLNSSYLEFETYLYTACAECTPSNSSPWLGPVLLRLAAAQLSRQQLQRDDSKAGKTLVVLNPHPSARTCARTHVGSGWGREQGEGEGEGCVGRGGGGRHASVQLFTQLYFSSDLKVFVSEFPIFFLLFPKRHVFVHSGFFAATLKSRCQSCDGFN